MPTLANPVDLLQSRPQATVSRTAAEMMAPESGARTDYPASVPEPGLGYGHRTETSWPAAPADGVGTDDPPVARTVRIPPGGEDMQRQPPEIDFCFSYASEDFNVSTHVLDAKEQLKRRGYQVFYGKDVDALSPQDWRVQWMRACDRSVLAVNFLSDFDRTAWRTTSKHVRMSVNSEASAGCIRCATILSCMRNRDLLNRLRRSLGEVSSKSTSCPQSSLKHMKALARQPILARECMARPIGPVALRNILELTVFDR